MAGTHDSTNGKPRRLTRLPDQGRLGGVCAGLADYLNLDVALVRVAWIVLSIWPGAIVFGVIAYVVAWFIMPPAATAGAGAHGRVLLRSRTERQVAGVCGGLAEYMHADPTVIRLFWAVLSIVPGAIVLGVAAYLVAWFTIPAEPAQTLHASPSTP